MKIEGVTFADELVSKMSWKKFRKTFERVFWQNREPEVREKLLTEAYRRLTGKEVTAD